MFVYKITNLVNGRGYIGLTRRRWASTRWKCHRADAKRGCQFPLHRAIRKYGSENFRFEVLYECVSVKELIACERGLIAAHGTYRPNGYNVTSGGEGSNDRVLSAQTRRKRSEIAKQMHADGRLKPRVPGTYAHSEETRAKIKARRKEALSDPARMARFVAAQRAAQSILTTSDVIEIKRLLTADYGTSLARMFGVSPATISSIKHGTRWGDVRSEAVNA